MDTVAQTILQGIDTGEKQRIGIVVRNGHIKSTLGQHQSVDATPSTDLKHLTIITEGKLGKRVTEDQAGRPNFGPQGQDNLLASPSLVHQLVNVLLHILDLQYIQGHIAHNNLLEIDRTEFTDGDVDKSAHGLIQVIFLNSHSSLRSTSPSLGNQ